MSGPLNGIRVFDLTRILAGPSCTQILADLGADVIKIERPGTGDDTRRFSPPLIKDAAGNETTESAYFCAANRNKRSVTLDIAKPRGQAIARQLIAESDVLVENFKTGDLAKYGLAYNQLKDDFPGLIYCSITGFGQTGPYAHRPGYDVLIQGMSGLMSCTGEPDGMPMKSAIPVADLMAGMYATTAVNAAIVHLKETGEGQHIDIGMLDVMVAFTSILGMNYLTSGEVPARLGNAHPNIVPYQAFPTKDNAIIVAVGNDSQFGKLCAVIGRPRLPEDRMFTNNSARVENRNALNEILNKAFLENTSKFWLAKFEAAGISCGPINNLQQVFEDPHVIARGMQIKMAHPAASGDEIDLLASPIRFTETPVTYRRPPPTLGEHTDHVLSEVLGVGDDELADLHQEAVI